MISFDCSHCGKALIVPNLRGGSSMNCPNCQTALTVPMFRPPSRLKYWIRGVVVLVLVSGMVAFVAYRVSIARRPQVLQERFSTLLKDHSPQWGGATWDRCDLENKDYKLTVYYRGSDQVYTFEAVSLFAGDEILIRVNPTPFESRGLASAVYSFGNLESFRYQGANAQEEELVSTLAADLASALQTATR